MMKSCLVFLGGMGLGAVIEDERGLWLTAYGSRYQLHMAMTTNLGSDQVKPTLYPFDLIPSSKISHFEPRNCPNLSSIIHHSSSITSSDPRSLRLRWFMQAGAAYIMLYAKAKDHPPLL